VADREIALPAGVAGVARGEGLGDGQAVAKGQQRAGEVALGDEHVADLLVADRKIALPAGIVGVARGEGLGDGQAVAKGKQRVKISLFVS